MNASYLPLFFLDFCVFLRLEILLKSVVFDYKKLLKSVIKWVQTDYLESSSATC